MPPFVSFFIVWNVDIPIFLRGNDGSCTTVTQVLAQVVGVESPVGHQGIECETVEQVRHPDDLTALAGKQFETHEVSKGVGEGKNFGRQSTFRTPDGLIESPPFAPLAFW